MIQNAAIIVLKLGKLAVVWCILVTYCHNERQLRFYLGVWTFWGGDSIFNNTYLGF